MSITVRDISHKRDVKEVDELHEKGYKFYLARTNHPQKRVEALEYILKKSDINFDVEVWKSTWIAGYYHILAIDREVTYEVYKLLDKAGISIEKQSHLATKGDATLKEGHTRYRRLTGNEVKQMIM